MIERPPTPEGFDPSRAAERRTDPAGWRFAEDAVDAVRAALFGRRDIRRFRPDPLPDELVLRLLEAAHTAPSVGLSQPWRFVLVRDERTKAAAQAHAAQQRLVQRDAFGGRSGAFLDLKVEGIREAPLSIVVCCDRGAEPVEVLGRHSIRDTDLYSTACAVQNLWLAARAEGVGVGWVSFYREDWLQELLGLPAHVVPVAWLCVGWPDERPPRPGLEAAGWDRRVPLGELVHEERWTPRGAERSAGARGSAGGAGSALSAASDPPAASDSSAGTRSVAALRPGPVAARPPAWWAALAAAVRPADPSATVAVRDRADRLLKPRGSLGLLEELVERYAASTGAPPSAQPRAGILVLAADHGVARRGVSLFPGRVSRQVAEAAARGETAAGVLARGLDAELVVADLGLAEPAGGAVVPARVAAGCADSTLGPALTRAQLRRAVEAGARLAGELAARADVLIPGEIGIGNTTAAAALLSALSGLPPDRTCGRGTGLDAQGLERKRAVVAQALAANGPWPADPLECLRRVGGLELAGLAGAMLAAAAARTPIVLDGFAVGVVALAVCRLVPALRDHLVAGHLSAEPAHRLVLGELGLEPLLDLRLRLGEASGAALALPLIGLAGRLHRELGTFAEAGVSGPEDAPEAC